MLKVDLAGREKRGGGGSTDDDDFLYWNVSLGGKKPFSYNLSLFPVLFFIHLEF